MDFLKRILIIALCSILFVCACPAFSTRSEAAEVALSTEFLRSAIGYLSGYLVSKGYSISKNLSLNTDVLDDTLDRSVLYQIYQSYFSTLRTASEAYANELESALYSAYNSGVFSISEDLDEYLEGYFETQTIDSSFVLGMSDTKYMPYDSSESVDYSFLYSDVSISGSSYSATVSVSLAYDYLPVIYYDYYNNVLNAIYIYYLPTERVTSRSTMNSYLNNSSVTVSNNGTWNSSDITSLAVRSVELNGVSCYTLVGIIYFNFSRYLVSSSSLPSFLAVPDNNASIKTVFDYFLTHGYYLDSLTYESNQIVDTTDKDILSSASEVDPETGAVSGGFTMYMRDWSLFQQILRQFSSGILSWTQAIKALGLSQVSADATPAEKESALDSVAYPDSTYDWFTSTTWDNGLTQTVKDEVATAHETELDIADELAETINGGNEPSDEDKNKAGNAMLLATLLMYLGLWDPPGFDPEDTQTPGIGDGVPTDPTKPNMLVETLTGMGVAGGFINDLWDSVGGSQGLGIIFTVGASFVVFSVIIGGSNYLGSLQSPDVSNNIDISKERSRIPQNNVPLLTTSKKSRRRK